jgi:hypothetical protein
MPASVEGFRGGKTSTVANRTRRSSNQRLYLEGPIWFGEFLGDFA